MDNKQPPPPPENDAAALEAAIKRAEAEITRVEKLEANKPTQIDSGPTPARGRAKATSLRSQEPGLESGAESVHLLNKILYAIEAGERITKRQLWAAIIAIVVGTLALIATVVIGIISTNRSAERAEIKFAQTQLVITFPPDGTGVGLGQKVRGITPFPDRNHYLVVTMVRTGSAQIQLVSVGPDGSFSGEARFNNGGSNTVGEDDEFTIRVLATMSRLEPGALNKTPDDAILSEPITVRRTKPSDQIIITAPANGTEVGLDGTITGKTSFPDLTHYIVVKSLRVGTRYVQDRPASISRNDGTFSGSAKFGGVDVGVGEQYEVQILATTSNLPAGPLTKDPPDAVLSNSVTLTRKK